MAETIKKVRILKKDLGNLIKLSTNSSGYKIKYRIVSEDRNRVSEWSDIKDIIITTSDTRISVSNSVNITENAITLYWTLPSVLSTSTNQEVSKSAISEYDIYVKWDNDDWQYVTTTTEQTYSIIKKSGKQNVKFLVQQSVHPTALDEVLPGYPNGKKGLVLFVTESRAIGDIGNNLIDGGSVV
jgi:hypothetical protein